MFRVLVGLKDLALGKLTSKGNIQRIEDLQWMERLERLKICKDGCYSGNQKIESMEGVK